MVPAINVNVSLVLSCQRIPSRHANFCFQDSVTKSKFDNVSPFHKQLRSCLIILM
jgi:hypothetical protein